MLDGEDGESAELACQKGENCPEYAAAAAEAALAEALLWEGMPPWWAIGGGGRVIDIGEA